MLLGYRLITISQSENGNRTGCLLTLQFQRSRSHRSPSSRVTLTRFTDDNRKYQRGCAKPRGKACGVRLSLVSICLRQAAVLLPGVEKEDASLISVRRGYLSMATLRNQDCKTLFDAGLSIDTHLKTEKDA